MAMACPDPLQRDLLATASTLHLALFLEVVSPISVATTFINGHFSAVIGRPATIKIYLARAGKNFSLPVEDFL